MTFTLEPVPVAAIVEYPDAFGKGPERCVQLARGPMFERADELQAYIAKTADSPEHVAECCSSLHCGGLLEGLTADPAFASSSHPVRVTKAGDKYYPGGSGHHRICIAKRAGLDLIMARVTEVPANHPAFTFLPPIGELGHFRASLRMRGDSPWEGGALYITETEATSHGWRPVTQVEADPAVRCGKWCRPWPSKHSWGVQVPLQIRSLRRQTRFLGLLPSHDILDTEVRLEEPTGRRLALARVTYVAGRQVAIDVLYRSPGWNRLAWDRLEPTSQMQPWLAKRAIEGSALSGF